MTRSRASLDPRFQVLDDSEQGLFSPLNRFDRVRARSEALAAPLSAEDQGLQSMPDASPTKWHLAHTTWFFETVIVAPFDPHYVPFDLRYAYLFNSYYDALGDRHPRAMRGLLSRPSVSEIQRYRRHVTRAVQSLLENADDPMRERIQPLLELAIAHEEQHQELLLTDIKHALYQNPLKPAYIDFQDPVETTAAPLEWLLFSDGRYEIGAPDKGFAFDNERPRHQQLLRPFRLASRLVTCGEYRAFIADGGYQRPEFWLSDGWALCKTEGWRAPLYWELAGNDAWHIYTLGGMRALRDDEPVVHVSLYEAAAYADWAGGRLPTEFEWEAAAAAYPVTGNFLDPSKPSPRAAVAGPGIGQLFGDAWEWTRSSYDPYPGFRPFSGVAAEYNGKFMVGQIILRGGSCCTPVGHMRPSYRNFFPPGARWQFSGIRLAEDA